VSPEEREVIEAAQEYVARIGAVSDASRAEHRARGSEPDPVRLLRAVEARATAEAAAMAAEARLYEAVRALGVAR
jgi:hypothetical protein